MRATVKLPRVADTGDEVAVLEWLVGPGEDVVEGGLLITVETDKATVDVPSPVSGRVIEHLVAAGDEIPIGTPIAVIEMT